MDIALGKADELRTLDHPKCEYYDCERMNHVRRPREYITFTGLHLCKICAPVWLTKWRLDYERKKKELDT